MSAHPRLSWLSDRFELSRGGSSANVRSMEGLRGFAVFLVFLVHYVTLSEPLVDQLPGLTAFTGAVHTVGNAGVDLFFVLSGYLIYGSLIARPQPFLAFMARRVQRIYPVFLAVLAVYVLLSFLSPQDSKFPPGLAASAIYLAENILLLPGLFPIEPIITVAWSLSYEMFYYIAIPGLIAAFRLRRRSRSWRVGFFLILTAVIVACSVLYGAPVRLIMFVSGILLFEAMRTEDGFSPGPGWGLAALVAGLAFMLAPLPGEAGFAAKIIVLFGTFWAFCLSCFRAPQTWLPRLFCWTPLRWLGNMSYSYYLLHGLTLKIAFVVLASVLPMSGADAATFWLLLPPLFVATLISSAMLFLAIERPLSLASRPRRSGGAESQPSYVQSAP
jgi:exopolysaccharide production protein ExoZ